jgi:sigma-B regulation protein RsbU (phosphoserine phosphatase)
VVAARWARARDVLIPLGVLGILVLVDALLPPSLVVTGTFALAAILACAITTVTRTAFVAVACTVMAAVSAVWNDNFGSAEWWIRMVLVVIGGSAGVILAWIRVRREWELRQMTAIAEAAQRALLRAMPASIGPLGFAARYVSATEEALVGGDLYEVAETPNGVRIIVGDARGKGLEAVQMAATVLAAFRHAAVREPSLTAVATDLDEVVTAVAEDEDFVTAVLAEFHDDRTVTLLNCGHHPPLLLANAHSRGLVDTGSPEPPLGLGPEPSPVTCQLDEGARLLFYTDGLVESRNREGTFFPLEDSAEALSTDDFATALDGLLSRVVDHVGQRRVNDDVALLLIERQDRDERLNA